MKKINIFYWIFNGLICALMLFSGINSLADPVQTKLMVTDHLKYPEYFMTLLSIAKIFGAIAILVPGFKRLKEWAYAGFAFDLIFATYSFIAVGDPVKGWAPMVVILIVFALAYFFYIKKQNAASGIIS
jgi:uncharacterized membrane protein YphA (DoxX/SURF4 family)